ncbi:hypothetical protein BHE74_00012475, partial [Ensete ventricosum]
GHPDSLGQELQRGHFEGKAPSKPRFDRRAKGQGAPASPSIQEFHCKTLQSEAPPPTH